MFGKISLLVSTLAMYCNLTWSSKQLQNLLFFRKHARYVMSWIVNKRKKENEESGLTINNSNHTDQWTIDFLFFSDFYQQGVSWKRFQQSPANSLIDGWWWLNSSKLKKQAASLPFFINTYYILAYILKFNKNFDFQIHSIFHVLLQIKICKMLDL